MIEGEEPKAEEENIQGEQSLGQGAIGGKGETKQQRELEREHLRKGGI